jgi:hypothetical protein
MHCFVTMRAIVEGAAIESLAGGGPPSDPGTDGQTMQAQDMVIALSRERYSLRLSSFTCISSLNTAGASVLDAKLSGA